MILKLEEMMHEEIEPTFMKMRLKKRKSEKWFRMFGPVIFISSNGKSSIIRKRGYQRILDFETIPRELLNENN